MASPRRRQRDDGSSSSDDDDGDEEEQQQEEVDDSSSDDNCSDDSSSDDAEDEQDAATFDKSAPLAVALLQEGLTEQQILHDKWTALMSLPQEAVDALAETGKNRSKADEAAVDQHATLEVVRVKPSSPLSFRIFCRVVQRFAFSTRGRRTLMKPTVRDALIALRPHVTTGRACQEWCCAVANLTGGVPANARVFGTGSMYEALLSIHPHAMSGACMYWCGTICNMACHIDLKNQLGREAMRDALVAVGAHATTAAACEAWCAAMHGMTNGANQWLFGTSSVRDALVAVSPHVKMAAACEYWCDVMFFLTENSKANKQLFYVEAVRKAHASLGDIAATNADAKKSWNRFGAALQRPVK
jgi:hypothetical protein